MKRVERLTRDTTARTEKSLSRMEGAVKKADKAFDGFARGFAAGAVAAAIGTLTAMVKGAVTEVAALADEAKRAGTSAEDLQAIAFAAHQAGVETSETTDLFQKLNKTIGEAATKGNDLGKILAANGVPLRDQNGQVRSTKEIFYDVVDLIARAKSQQEATTLATAAFTKAAEDAIPFLRQGSEVIKEGEERARKLGAVISNEIVAKADEFDDRWTEAWDVFSAQGKAAIIEVIEFMQKFDPNRLGLLARQAILDSFKEETGATKINDLLEKRLYLEQQIAAAEAGQSGVALLGQWRQELEEINRQLAITGPAFEKTGRGVAPRPLPGISRNAFDTGRGVVFPETGGGESPVDAWLKREQAAREAAAKKAADAAARQKKAIEDVISALQFEQEQLQSSDLEQEINNQLRQAGVTAASAQGQQITALVQKNFELAQSEELAKEAGEQWLEAQEALYDSMQALAELGLDAFDSWIAGGEKLTDVLEDVARQMAKAAVQAALFGSGPMAGLFGTSQNGGVFGGLFRQAGGGNLHTGRPTLVGERGPELIVPKGAGYVVPNSGLRGSSGVGFTIIDQRRGGETLKPQRDNRGNPLLVIRDMVRSENQNSWGSEAFGKFMSSVYGLTPVTKRR